MKNIYRNIAIWSVVALLIVVGIFGSRFRRDNPSVDPGIVHEMNTSSQIAFDAPIYELVTWPTPHVDSYNPETKIGIVGMYSWFGLRVGGVTMNNCTYGTPGNFNNNFSCGGGTIQYLF